MSNSIKIRAKQENNQVKVKVLIKHPMETGLRKNKKTGQTIPAHFIQEVVCKHNGNTVLESEWGVAISTNPFLSFALADAKPGDKIAVTWRDNLGESDTQTVAVK